MIFKLNNPIKNFQWGSTSAFSDLFKIANPHQLPQAELWMGAHPNGSSTITIDKKESTLVDAISSNPSLWLGDQSGRYEDKLPFLVKILAANQPLSIQVHPSKEAAQVGFDKENEQGIALDAAERNFKDANHKPELVYAITPYLAMNGFRELSSIHRLFSAAILPSIKAILDPFLSNPTQETLEQLFAAILLMGEKQKASAVSELLSFEPTLGESAEVMETFKLITELAKLYPSDVGLFSPLFLNVVELKPGEAMFLFAETPHAYLKGVGVEVMANSDNVLRAGLTPKYIDVPELLANTKFEPIKASDLRMQPSQDGNRSVYPIPVDDFKFDIIREGEIEIVSSSPEILLCIEGSVEICSSQSRVSLKAGESVIIPAATSSYSFSNYGTVARTYC
ncbi:mannose-6-phosphate isomer [Vibrio cholerae]|uniref:mannose-6-phosphate isomerase, class I n=1 Tax=Vibrio cholerae TaxID=666 RepID=UPI0006E70FC2|nr:mannose-6-phosphate isomerase, class I [Vibrio cholerae]EGR2422862.1 mannose-6-phosphate isomerase, class I [Vibrio cholerae]EHY0936208.1 mannose-6-phosphate isomerase, class I [Vibrio cholerae]EIY4765819.1 mannose-6-phosphate isomerase, class I [Vibrio cholerae]EJL6597315.1 mannose-6-phosphate isomerase, class I [Vibrio cholerae]EJL6615529.1 mannose-6-phosphate isomerase, class I [Vibrio cholerae]